MLEQLLKIVEQNADKSIVQNEAIPNQFNHSVIKEVTNQIFTALQGQVAQGNMQQVIQLFRSGSPRGMSNHPVVSPMIENVAKSLAAKFNLPENVTRSVADSIVPTVMNQVIARTNDPKDIDFDLQQIMRRMTGNSTLDISGMLNQQKGGIGNIGNIFGKLFGK